jgi:hypothetical protein
MGFVEDLKRIKDRATELERLRARREADEETARRRRDEALSELKVVFGASSVDEAREVFRAKKAEVEREVAEVLSALEEVHE